MAWHAFRGARLPYWPLHRVLAIQRRRIRSMVRYAYANVAHYRETMDRVGLRPADVRTAEDLERLPLVSKEELLDAPEKFMAARVQKRGGLRIRSSGTSGRARDMVYDSRAVFLALAYGYRQRQALAALVGRSVGYREADLSRADGTAAQLRAFIEAR